MYMEKMGGFLLISNDELHETGEGPSYSAKTEHFKYW